MNNNLHVNVNYYYDMWISKEDFRFNESYNTEFFSANKASAYKFVLGHKYDVLWKPVTEEKLIRIFASSKIIKIYILTFPFL